MQKAPAMEWFNFLHNKIKVEEERDLGLLDYIRNKKNTVILSKSEILEYIDRNRLIINEKVLSQDEIHPVRLQYATKGLENYREIVISIPNVEPYYVDNIHFSNVANGEEICWCRCADYIKNKKKYLVIDEMQSYRHQDGHIKGYRHKNIYWNENYYKAIINNNLVAVEDRCKNLFDYIEKYIVSRNIIRNTPPAAPLKKWWEFIMKRILHYAAINGYDEISIIDGKAQAKRYQLDEDSGVVTLYDKIIMGFAKKYLKKWEIEPFNDSGAWHIVLAPEFKNDIIQNGQPLYRQQIDSNVDCDNSVRLNDIQTICTRFKMEVVSNKEIQEPGLLGWYNGLYDTCYIIYDNHNKIDEIKKTIIHESLAHRGLQRTLGRRYDYFLQQVWVNVMDEEVKEKYIQKYKTIFTAAAEFVADAFEKETHSSSIIQQICSLIKLCLIKVGLDCTINLDDIYNLASYSIRRYGLQSHISEKKRYSII